jgi:hypothetical protein
MRASAAPQLVRVSPLADKNAQDRLGCLVRWHWVMKPAFTGLRGRLSKFPNGLPDYCNNFGMGMVTPTRTVALLEPSVGSLQHC